MLTPKQLDDIPNNLVRLYSILELSVIKDIARRISQYDFFIPSAEFQYKKLIDMRLTHDEIIKLLSQNSSKTEREIEKMMHDAGVKALKFDDSIYKKAGLNPLPIAKSLSLQRILLAGIKRTMGSFRNLTRTTAVNCTKQFEEIIDTAYMQVMSGAFDRTTAIKNAVKKLSDRGIIAFEYANNFKTSIEAAVRRTILTGINQTVGELQVARADEMECDLVEITAHAGARTGEGIANHAGWQGKVYSRSGTSKKYPDFVKSTGYGTISGLCGVNCRHNFFPFFEGISKRAYTDEQLSNYSGENYVYNGKKMTEYEALQKQRYIERQIRTWKREEIAMSAAGLPTDEAKSKIAKWQGIQRDFINQTGLRRQYDREKVYTYGEKERDSVKSARNKIIKSQAPKIIKADNIRLQHKIDYDIITKSGIHKQGIVPSCANIENVTVIAGYGTSTNIRVAETLSEEYGGDYFKWQKKAGIIESKYGKYEIHWYEYDNVQYKEKLKSWREK